MRIEILFRGICHSDLHQVRDEWHNVMPTVSSDFRGSLPRFTPGALKANQALIDLLDKIGKRK